MTAASLAVAAGGFAAGGALAALAPSPRLSRIATAAGAIVGCAGALVAAAGVLGMGRPLEIALPHLVSAAGGILIHLDRLGALFLALIASIGLLAAIYGVSYTAEYDRTRSLGSFGVMFNGFLFGMCLVSAAGNAFTFALAWELMAVSSYFLVMTESERPETRAAGLWYAGMTHLGLVLLLPMFLLMAPAPGATTFAELRAGALALPEGARHAVFLLALAAFGSKAGLMPLHVWLPRAHPAAPSHVSALMSAVMIKLGIYGLLRVTIDFLGPGPAWWGGLLLAAGSASALGGILYALTENDLKRLLAYSSVENVGVIVLGTGTGLLLQSHGLEALGLAAIAAALLHTVNHAAFKSLLFLGAGNVLQHAHTRNMNLLGGLIKRMPQTATLFVVGSAAASALPPLNGFSSEWLIFQALLSAAQIPPPGGAVAAPLAIGVLALTSGLAAACFVKAFGISFLAMPRSERAAEAREAHPASTAGMWVLAASCFVLGLASPSMAQALTRLVDTLSVEATAATLVAPTPLWLLAPGGPAQISPAFIGLLLGAAIVVTAVLVQLRGLRLRHADTWGCGRIRHTPRMEYTSSAFAEPLRRVFSQLYRPTQDLKVSAFPESRYFVRAITYTSTVVPWFEKALYDPVVRSVRRVSARVRQLQAGSTHAYLLYVVTALLVALAATWIY
ncbi:MAG TPA: proton-conducting transporter membrane subunit [Vicinamibacterales bacterium]|nr:proton-conducting transporter membrane subunit [Vicinamibacterales bacterium]